MKVLRQKLWTEAKALLVTRHVDDRNLHRHLIQGSVRNLKRLKDVFVQIQPNKLILRKIGKSAHPRRNTLRKAELDDQKTLCILSQAIGEVNKPQKLRLHDRQSLRKVEQRIVSVTAVFPDRRINTALLENTQRRKDLVQATKHLVVGIGHRTTIHTQIHSLARPVIGHMRVQISIGHSSEQIL